jgi:hypothetical protein
MMTQRQAWAKRHGIPHGKVNCLMALVTDAYNAQEKEMNGEAGVDSSLPFTNRVATYAKELGFTGIMWPGMYPVLLKGTEQIHLPE